MPLLDAILISINPVLRSRPLVSVSATSDVPASPENSRLTSLDNSSSSTTSQSDLPTSFPSTHPTPPSLTNNLPSQPQLTHQMNTRYALTASPPIYVEIVQEMWSTTDCTTTRCGINLAIKGKSYIITPSVINEALRFPESNFENIPTHGEITFMFKAINYAGNPWSIQILLKNKFRKEWSQFFDTLMLCLVRVIGMKWNEI
ncbi:hypothetical protein POM88_034694 [Heracleum sosnowskyi]|uniref:Uncharacterized protein n=1 Tax=Heracleum sosnowskyi TaxID=360622 RepID=A0AAD8HJR4_9APIA|nr:hypothetical protein POM88_034694 [Heracleum sosnowskyi]